jgi:hypothetical protein
MKMLLTFYAALFSLSFQTLNAASTLPFQATVVSEKIEGGDLEEKLATTIEWKESGESFSHHLRMSRFGQQSLDLTDVFDGTTLSSLDRSGASSVVRIFESKPNRVLGFDYGASPLQPFQFLTTSTRESNDNIPRFQQVQDFFESLLKGEVQTSDQEFLGTTALAINRAAGESFERGSKISYTAFLSKEDTKKILGWRKTIDGALAAELQVEKWISLPTPYGKNIELPAAWKVVYFSNKDGSSKRTFAYHVVASFSDPWNVSDNSFSLDPASADFIYDVKHGTVIQVPR